MPEPTDDRDAVRSSLDSIQGDIGTALGDAIEASVALADDHAEDNVGEKPLFAVLLLSDGANTASEPLPSWTRRRRPAPIYTIALGTPSGTVDVTDDYGQTQTVNVPPDPTTLRQIAEQTGGRFFEAPTEADLKAVYEEIGSQVSWEDDERELTAAFAAAGAVFLLIGASLSALWFGRIP